MREGQRILADVPEIGFGRRADRGYHFCPLPGSVHAVMTYLKEPMEYGRLMAVSGAGFRSVWQKDDGGNVDLMYLAPTPHERLFDAIGFDYQVIDGRNEEGMRAAIVKSIDRGVPVIAFGIMGPPEAGVVTGYEEGGKVLRGWSYFDHEPKGAYYQRENWYARMEKHVAIGAIVIGAKRERRPTERATAVATLEWAIELATTKQRKELPEHVFGTAAYDAWIAALGVDGDFPAEDAKVMGHRRMLYDDQLMMLSERGHAAKYLAELAVKFPEGAEPLKRAAALYKEAGDCAEPLSATRKRIAEKGVRTEAVVHIRAARDAEAKGVEELKRALKIVRLAPASVTLEPTALKERDEKVRQAPENVPVPAALRALLEVTGDDFGQRYLDEHKKQWQQSNGYLLMGLATGAWFQNGWFRKDGTQATRLVAPLEAGPYEKALAAAGYRGVVMVREGKDLDLEAVRAAVVESIGVRGLPVVLVGVPDGHRAFLATGYAEGGKLLSGWSVTGGETIRFKAEKWEKVDAWEKGVQVVVAATQRVTRMPRRQVYEEALKRGVMLLRAKEMGEFHAGPATYEVWQKALLDETPAANEKALHERRVSAIEPLIWDLAERRAWAQVCLDDMAKEMPERAEDLRAAAKAYKQIHDQMWEISKLAGGKNPGDRSLPKLAEADVRAAIAGVMKKCRGLDEEAATRMERALAVR